MSLADQIRVAAEEERQRFGVPGCAVVVIKDGELVLSEGFGSRDVDRGLPVTSATLFAIGSATKTFTAALIGSLVDEGVLDLDAPVRTYLPGFRMHDPVATEQLTLRDCLAHRSGLPRHDILWYAGAGHLDRDDLIRALEFLPPSQPFRQVMQYNNLLYTLAGHLAGRLCGGSFEEAVTTRILKPLSMDRTNFDVLVSQQDGDHSQPYLQPHGHEAAAQVGFASLDLVGPAGNINSCADDLVAWLQALLGVGDHPPLLSTSLLTELRTPMVPLNGIPENVVVQHVGYGLAQIIEDHRGRRLTHHGGNIDGFASQVMTRVEDGIGIAVLTNLGKSGLRDALPYVILDLIDGVAPSGHGAYFKQRADDLAAQLYAAGERQLTEALPYGPVRPFADYVGTYRHGGYGEVVVALDGEQLTLRYLGLPPGVLVHRHLEVFVLVIGAGGAEQKVGAQFTHDLEGAVRSLRLELEPAVDPIEFARLPS